MDPFELYANVVPSSSSSWDHGSSHGDHDYQVEEDDAEDTDFNDHSQHEHVILESNSSSSSVALDSSESSVNNDEASALNDDDEASVAESVSPMQVRKYSMPSPSSELSPISSMPVLSPIKPNAPEPQAPKQSVSLVSEVPTVELARLPSEVLPVSNDSMVPVEDATIPLDSKTLDTTETNTTTIDQSDAVHESCAILPAVQASVASHEITNDPTCSDAVEDASAAPVDSLELETTESCTAVTVDPSTLDVPCETFSIPTAEAPAPPEASKDSTSDAKDATATASLDVPKALEPTRESTTADIPVDDTVSTQVDVRKALETEGGSDTPVDDPASTQVEACKALETKEESTTADIPVDNLASAQVETPSITELEQPSPTQAVSDPSIGHSLHIESSSQGHNSLPKIPRRRASSSRSPAKRKKSKSSDGVDMLLDLFSATVDKATQPRSSEDDSNDSTDAPPTSDPQHQTSSTTETTNPQSDTTAANFSQSTLNSPDMQHDPSPHDSPQLHSRILADENDERMQAALKSPIGSLTTIANVDELHDASETVIQEDLYSVLSSCLSPTVLSPQSPDLDQTLNSNLSTDEDDALLSYILDDNYQPSEDSIEISIAEMAASIEADIDRIEALYQERQQEQQEGQQKDIHSESPTTSAPLHLSTTEPTSDAVQQQTEPENDMVRQDADTSTQSAEESDVVTKPASTACMDPVDQSSPIAIQPEPPDIPTRPSTQKNEIVTPPVDIDPTRRNERLLRCCVVYVLPFTYKVSSQLPGLFFLLELVETYSVNVKLAGLFVSLTYLCRVVTLTYCPRNPRDCAIWSSVAALTGYTTILLASSIQPVREEKSIVSTVFFVVGSIMVGFGELNGSLQILVKSLYMGPSLDSVETVSEYLSVQLSVMKAATIFVYALGGVLYDFLDVTGLATFGVLTVLLQLGSILLVQRLESLSGKDDRFHSTATTAVLAALEDTAFSHQLELEQVQQQEKEQIEMEEANASRFIPSNDTSSTSAPTSTPTDSPNVETRRDGRGTVGGSNDGGSSAGSEAESDRSVDGSTDETALFQSILSTDLSTIAEELDDSIDGTQRNPELRDLIGDHSSLRRLQSSEQMLPLELRSPERFFVVNRPERDKPRVKAETNEKSDEEQPSIAPSVQDSESQKRTETLNGKHASTIPPVLSPSATENSVNDSLPSPQRDDDQSIDMSLTAILDAYAIEKDPIGWIDCFLTFAAIFQTLLNGLLFSTGALLMFVEYNIPKSIIGVVYAGAAASGVLTSLVPLNSTCADFLHNKLPSPHNFYFFLFLSTYCTLMTAMPFMAAYLAGFLLVNVSLAAFMHYLTELQGTMSDTVTYQTLDPYGQVVRRIVGFGIALLSPILYDMMPHLPNIIASCVCFFFTLVVYIGFEAGKTAPQEALDTTDDDNLYFEDDESAAKGPHFKIRVNYAMRESMFEHNL